MATSPASGDPGPFLADIELRPFRLADEPGLVPVGLAIGQGRGGLEVAVTRAEHRPTQQVMRAAWNARLGGRAVPLLLVALHGDRAALCGEHGDDPPVYLDLDRGMVERLCRTALAEPDRHAASRFLRAAMPELESPLPGLRNEGLFATHELARDVPQRRDWADAQTRAAPLLGLRGRRLLGALGYQIEALPGHAAILRAGDTRIAVAVFLERGEACDVASDRFGSLSPISYALAKADAESLPYVVVDHGPALRIYPTATGVGTGGRGRTETFIEVHLDLLPTDRAGYLWLLFSGEALLRTGAFQVILENSRRFASDLGSRLRERIYRDVVPDLAMALVQARHQRHPTAQDLETTYEMALTVLFRLLFIAYAEDKDLLPYRTNERYRARSLKQKAHELLALRRAAADAPAFDDSPTLWREVSDLCRAVNGGHREWGVPPYNGGLFSEDRAHSEVGALLADLTISNREFGPVLANLLIEETPEGLGPVDFRSLGVREFGTVYEGLLESELSVAEVNLVTDRDGLYFPAEEDQRPDVPAGHVYLHNAGGARKATGSYYTKGFAVEHLLDHALEPALAEHLARLDSLDDRRAAEAFFDFRVADIAMGSGHFLITAVDHIEKRLSGYLARRRLPAVVAELERLRASAIRELGTLAEGVDIEDTQLLRRQIARRCVYGVDIKSVAVQLARLSLWIHTFVPGLPLSFLDHNIVCGNSLIGIATFDEVKELLELDGDAGLFDHTAEALLGSAMGAVLALGRLSDANAAEIDRARRALQEQKEAIEGTAQLFDVLTASRLPEADIGINPEDLHNALFVEGLHKRAKEALAALWPPFHFPIAFPEVFLGERPGFDVILGNPPWEKVRVEEHEFWARHFPGLRGLKTAARVAQLRRLKKDRPDLLSVWERERSKSEVLRDALRGLPGMNTGHPDLFRAFIWRFLQLTRKGDGFLGVVLPGDAFKIAGAEGLRLLFPKRCEVVDLQMLTNKRHWVFDEVHPQKLIALCVAKTRVDTRACAYRLRVEVHDSGAWAAGTGRQAAVVDDKWLSCYSPTLVVPILPAVGSIEVLQVFMAHAPLCNHKSLSLRRVYADFETSKHDKQYWHTKKRDSDWPVYKGESFDLWQPDTGNYYAWTDAVAIQEAANAKRQHASRLSPYSQMPPTWLRDVGTLPALFPRICFRDVTNRGNSRTLVCALIPPKVVTTQTAPWVLWLDPGHDLAVEAFLLGIMSSIPADWWSRRFVEGHYDQEAFACLRVPEYKKTSAHARRVVSLAARLASTDARFAEWAKAVGVEFGPLEVDEKDAMIYELDAVVAHLYGLSEAHLVHIFETFHEGWEYHPRLEAVLRHYRQWQRRV